MEEPVVFALTPRAGRWNHRFLVPRGFSGSQQELVAMADQARFGRADDIVCATREVQQNSGRCGPEMLIVRDARLRTRPDVTREAVQQELAGLQDALAGIVTGIDWETEGEALLLEHDGLADWRQQIDQLLTAACEKPLRPAVTRKRMTTFSREVTSKRLIFHLVLALTVLVLGIAVVSSLQTVPPPSRQETTRDDRSSFPSTGAVATLARSTGLDPEAVTPRDVLNHVRTSLFADRDAEESASRSLSMAQNTDLEELLLTTLQQLRRVIQPDDPTLGTLDACANHETLSRDLQRLFPDGRLDRSGLLADDEPDRFRDVRSLAEYCDYSVVATLLDASRTSGPACQGDGDMGSLARVLDRLQSELESGEVIESESARRFYVADDAATIESILAWYNANKTHPILLKLAIDTTTTSQPERNEREASVKDLGRFFVAVGQRFHASNEGIFSSDGLRSWCESQKLNQSEQADFAIRLLRFLDQCRQAARQRQALPDGR